MLFRSANMVPDHTRAEFSLRGKDKEEAEHAMERLLDCARAAATATGARMEWHMTGNPYHDMRPDPELAAIYERHWLAVGGNPPLTHAKPHGSLDIANLSHRFPCLHPSFSITDETAIVDTGSAHALKAVYVHGAAVSRIDQKLETFAQLRGRTVTFAVRVRKGVASSVRPYVVDSGVLIYGATDATTGAYTTM